MNPKKFKSNDINKVTKKTAQFIWDRDKQKIKDLIELNYEIIVIWENDWNCDRDNQILRITDAYNRI